MRGHVLPLVLQQHFSLSSCRNLGCNLITELSFGTFQAWHGMQFLCTLDMGKTHVTFKTVESIVMMSPKLEKLILASLKACCLCQFKNNTEIVCNTVKLHCDSECLTNTTYCEKPTVENTAVQNNPEENISTIVPEEPTPEVTARKKGSTADSALTVDNFMPTTKLTKETQREHHNVGTDVPSMSTAFTFPRSSSPGDHLKTQLNEQLQSFITNSDVRRLISHVVRTLKMGCSEPHLKLACAKLISRTGHLMKLLSEQQEAKAPRADWDTDQWKTENYIHESPETQSEQKEQESREFTKEVLGHGCHSKVILASSVTGAVTVLITAFCLIEERTTISSGFQRIVCL
ncbi:hypothetical protein MC885_012395 [Smutsia gigantea]|nr:hypothetical protein MC885_012395 [Smutsia gigantea]